MNFVLTPTSPTSMAVSFMHANTVHNIDLKSLEEVNIIHTAGMLTTIKADFATDMSVKDITSFVVMCQVEADHLLAANVVSFMDTDFPSIILELTEQYGYREAIHLNGIIQQAMINDTLDMEAIRLPVELTTVGIIQGATLSIWTSQYDTTPLLQTLNEVADDNSTLCPIIELSALAVSNFQQPTYEEEVVSLVLARYREHSTDVVHMTLTHSTSKEQRVEIMTKLVDYVQFISGPPIKKMAAITQLLTLS